MEEEAWKGDAALEGAGRVGCAQASAGPALPPLLPGPPGQRFQVN